LDFVPVAFGLAVAAVLAFGVAAVLMALGLDSASAGTAAGAASVVGDSTSATPIVLDSVR
jgi:hypothetical protein